MICPINPEHGEMWDNRPKKAAGEFKPNSPDFRCKEKTCSGVIWPEKKQTNHQAQVTEKIRETLTPTGVDSPPVPRVVEAPLEPKYDPEAKDRGIAMLSYYKSAIITVRDMSSAGIINVQRMTPQDYMKHVLQTAKAFYFDAQQYKSGLIRPDEEEEEE